MRIPLTSTMCLGWPPSTPIPRCQALESMAEQQRYLESVPPLKDLVEVWLPWSWRLAFLDKDKPNFSSWDETKVRAECLRVRDLIERAVAARPGPGRKELDPTSPTRLKSFKAPESLLEELAQAASAAGVTQSQAIREGISLWIEKHSACEVTAEPSS